MEPGGLPRREEAGTVRDRVCEHECVGVRGCALMLRLGRLSGARPGLQQDDDDEDEDGF